MPVDDGKTYYSPEAEMLARENEQLRSRIADLGTIIEISTNMSSHLSDWQKNVNASFQNIWNKIEIIDTKIMHLEEMNGD